MRPGEHVLFTQVDAALSAWRPSLQFSLPHKEQGATASLRMSVIHSKDFV